VDEITSDVFLAVFTKIATFSGDEGGFKALLHTIARRRVTDELRRRGRRVQIRAWSTGEEHGTTDSLEETVLVREHQQELLSLVGRLSPAQRDVILLRLVADLSIDEVAHILGKRAGSVKSLQRRGLDALRRSLVCGPPDPAPLGRPTCEEKT